MSLRALLAPWFLKNILLLIYLILTAITFTNKTGNLPPVSNAINIKHAKPVTRRATKTPRLRPHLNNRCNKQWLFKQQLVCLSTIFLCGIA